MAAGVLSMSLASAMRRTTGGQSTVDKSFAGGDRYVGQWKEGLVSQIYDCCHKTAELHPLSAPFAISCLLQPEGEGKYVWTDQSIYEGGWKVQHNLA